MKRVCFVNTTSPPLPQKCKCCGHRNIKPRIRDFFTCSKCHRKFCIQCFTYTEPRRCVDCMEVRDKYLNIFPVPTLDDLPKGQT